MRYTKNHKSESKDKIVYNALKLFSHRGFDNVSIDEVMVAAGLTRGAFYAHFKNKQALYSAAILSSDLNSKQSISSDADGMSTLKQLVSVYLNADKLDSDSSPCPLAYLVTDVANREPDVRSAYELSFKTLNMKIKALMSSHDSIKKEETILALTSMMIGSVAIARILSNPERKMLLNSCKNTVYDLIDDIS